MGKPKQPAFKSVDTPYLVTKNSGAILDGVITSREGESMVGPIIVFAHGTLSSANHNFTDELTQKLSNELGLRSFRFNFRFDKSEAEPDHRYKFSGYDDDVSDLEAVVKTLRADGYSPWCFFGHSRGSNDVLLYATKHTSEEAMNPDDECKSDSATDPAHRFEANKIALVVTAPRFDMARMSTTIFTPEQLATVQETGSCVWPTQRGDLLLTKEDLEVTDTKMDMGKVVETLPSVVPILLLHGTDDELIPVEDAHQFKKARTSIDVSIIDGARHAFRGKKQNKALLSVVTEWLDSTYSKMSFDQFSSIATDDLVSVDAALSKVTVQA